MSGRGLRERKLRLGERGCFNLEERKEGNSTYSGQDGRNSQCSQELSEMNPFLHLSDHESHHFPSVCLGYFAILFLSDLTINPVR